MDYILSYFLFFRENVRGICTCVSSMLAKETRRLLYLCSHQKLRWLSSLKMQSDLVVHVVDTPEFHALLTPELLSLKAIFDKYNYELRMAGGAVRDLMMGVQPTDIDLASVATPEQMKAMFEAEEIRIINPSGEKHGTITARINDKENFEVTTLRIDVRTFGRHAHVEWTTDWAIDAQRRDLTVNAMFLGLDGKLYDYFNGVKDLKDRKIRFVGSAVDRIEEDYLRILRYFRFFGRLSHSPDSHDPSILEAIYSHREGMGKISGERIWLELKRILSGRYAGQCLSTIGECGLFPFIGLPEADLPRRTKNMLALWKRFENTSSSLHAISLLTGVLDQPEEMLEFHARAKLSCFERDLGLFLLFHRDDPVSNEPKWSYQSLIVDNWRQKEADVKLWIAELMKIRGDEGLMDEVLAWRCPVFPVGGAQMKELGTVPPGKAYSIVLQELREVWKLSRCTLSLGELLERVPAIVEKYDFKKEVKKKQKSKEKL